MLIIIIPGIHSPQSTDRFIEGIQDRINQNYLIMPTEEYLPYSAISISQWLNQQQLAKTEPLAFITFSAGVVGGIGTAIAWQLQGGKVPSFIAIDGWGMPLVANFPIYRVSHDHFTHWSSAILGAAAKGFYADPAVEHLELWRSPENCWGWRTMSHGLQTRCLLTDYLKDILDSRY
ncbi:MAG: hypothetical protein WBM86_02480 [Waterburya sp.]